MELAWLPTSISWSEVQRNPHGGGMHMWAWTPPSDPPREARVDLELPDCAAAHDWRK